MGDNRVRVASDIDSLKSAPNPTRACLAFVVDEILGPLRASDLALPPFFYTIDEKMKTIVNGK